ncbi:MAG: hypothetical protein KAW14_14270 [Candidatus Aegiribacteria sp.]|nr:hypothetical protein [Candidatus Aegiribacteria sp.]
MINVDEIYNTLKHIGLSENEVRVYLALLKKEKCSPADVGRISGLNRTMVYDLLKSLETKGACKQINTGKKIYEPLDPSLLLKKVKSNLEQEVESVEEFIRNKGDDLADIYRKTIGSNTEIDYITVFKDPIQIAEEIISLTSNTREEMLLFTIAPKLESSIRRMDVKILKDIEKRNNSVSVEAFINRGVKLYSIMSLNNMSERLIIDTMGLYGDCSNVDVRIVNSVPCKMMVFDGRDILISLKSRVDSQYPLLAFHLEDDGLGEALRTSFYSYFNSAPSVRNMDIDILINEKKIVMLDN